MEANAEAAATVEAAERAANATAASDPQCARSGDDEGSYAPVETATKPKGLLLVASRAYSSSEEEDEQEDAGELVSASASASASASVSGAEDAREDREELEDKAPPSEGDYMDRPPSSVASVDEHKSAENDGVVSSSSAGTEERPKGKQKARVLSFPRRDSLDDLELSVESLQAVAHKRGLDIAALSGWSVRTDGKLQDPDGRKYRSLRDALRAFWHTQRGSIPREDMYFLAILRRRLAEGELPLVDGPIRVLSLGTVVPEDHFYTSKKLFPIGYETLVNVQLTKPTTCSFRLRCKIVHGNKKKSPIFVVELEKSTEFVFRSYVASKAWKKALAHFESLSAEELTKAVGDSALSAEAVVEAKAETGEAPKELDVLTPSSGEDGFGLLRRNITRVLEGLHQVLQCKDYQFWEQRHVITPDVHAKLRARLKGQMKEHLKAQGVFSKEEIKRQLTQEIVLEEHSHNHEELGRIQAQKEKDRLRLQAQKEKEQREADKKSVREAARKLLEIEMKAQQDAKEAQRRAKEERKNAILEAKLEAARQKEARKEALRLAKEEEKRLREKEKEMKRVLREEEKRKKMEEKENSMKRRIEELRQRRQLREEQKAILENGVMTSSSPRRTVKRRSANGTPDAQSIRQQHQALLKFVEEEKDRRRRIRVWEKQREVEQAIWTRVKREYVQDAQIQQSSLVETDLARGGSNSAGGATRKGVGGASFPLQVAGPASELDAVPSESHADLFFVWDFIATFSDCLKLTVLPSLGVFVEMLTLSDGSSAVGDGVVEEDSMGRLFASLHAELLKVLVPEYFPVLQMGTKIDEFFRTRPMNVFSWPELARQVCQLAMEVKHPSADERLLKSLKGTKSYRDDSVVVPLREKLQRRGTKLLKGVQFEEAPVEPEVSTRGVVGKNSTTLASESNAASSASRDYYGVVLVDGLWSRVQVGQKDEYLVVTSVNAPSDAASSCEDKKQSEVTSNALKDDNADRLRVGDYLVCVNGRNVRGMKLEAFQALMNEIPAPHGLLMASVVPVVKMHMRHIPTTLGSTKMKRCGHVLKLLRAKEIAAPFNQPVDAELYPDYYSSGDITEPMDLGTISEKIEDEDYENDDVESFVDDVSLVWKNCYTYNSLKAEISNLAQKLSVVFERLMKEWVYTTVNRPLVAGEEDNCRSCQTLHVKGRLLLCDRCDAPYHTFCLASPLAEIPKGEWFCPTCVADPSFSPEQFRKRAVDVGGSSDVKNEGHEFWNDEELTAFEKRLQAAIGLLSQENYSQLSVRERLSVLRVLCELLEETAVVQSTYHSLEEKVNQARREFGEPLADLEREWDAFCPPRTSHGVEPTKKFIIDGVEHELTDELLLYLEEKAKAELESNPVPPLPESAQRRLREASDGVKTEVPVVVELEDEGADTSDDSEADEEAILEEFGDHFLLSSTQEHEQVLREQTKERVLSRTTCAFCGLEDGILNGPLCACKRSPLTHQTSLLDHYDVPELLTDEEGSELLTVWLLNAEDMQYVILESTPEGVQYSERPRPQSTESTGASGSSNFSGGETEGAPSQLNPEGSPEAQQKGSKGVIYAINDRVVFGMSRLSIRDQLMTAARPISLYLTSVPGEALQASVSIIKCHTLQMGLNLDSQKSLVFVKAYYSAPDFPVGFGQLSGQVFPGDVLLMINDVHVRGKDVNDVQDLLNLESPTDAKYVVFVRSPSAKMKKAVAEWQTMHDLPSQRAKQSALRTALMSPLSSQRISFDVTFINGPLGLALALEERGVVVKSLNDHADGTLGQASVSGRILCGDLVELVNGKPYGALQDLSQFTSWLLSLPRPLRITFSRPAHAGENGMAFSNQPDIPLDQLLRDTTLLCEKLEVPATSALKTFQVQAFPLPFEAEDCPGSLGVIATNGLVYCEPNASGKSEDTAMNGENAPPTVAVGDRVVGLNGKRLAGLSWGSVKELCMELSSSSPVYLHLIPRIDVATQFQAHEACVQHANVAWSECGYMVPRVKKARKLESFIKWMVIPRTLALGKCRNGYTLYRFFSDCRRVYVLSPEKKWLICDTKAQLVQLLAYLDADRRDADLADRVRWCFHASLYSDDAKHMAGAREQVGCCGFSEESFLREGPFAMEREVMLAVSETDMETYEASTGYHGRKFLLGSFGTQQQAEIALQQAESSILSTGLHLSTASAMSALHNARFPSLDAPVLKAENYLKRSFGRKYEYGSVMDTQGSMKPIPLSHDIYQTLKRGLRSAASVSRMSTMPPVQTHYQGMHPAMARNPGNFHPSASYGPVQMQYQDSLKRKYAQTEDRYLRQNSDQLKRSRYQAEQNPAGRRPSGGHVGMQQQYASAPAGSSDAVNFKRSLQALVDQGRSMLAAWNQFAAEATPQATNGLAYACLSSFEEVKKAVSRVVVDPNGSLPDPKTFVCLHHAFVMGLICAMATQALTTSQKTKADSALVKQVADAFATSILSCVDPSSMLRARALSGFATAAKKCEPAQRSTDLSTELHNVANFVLQFLQTTHYLSGPSFEDLSDCRPLFSASTPGVETLPQSFVQQITLLEKVREQFTRQISQNAMNAPRRQTASVAPGMASSSSSSLQASPYGMMANPSSMAAQDESAGPAVPNDTFVDVQFGYGPLGVVINYSHRGTIIVTEFSDDNGMMGQAQASGKILVGDEVYAVNGDRLEVIGMEGFKAAVGTRKRPLRVTFRRTTPPTPGARSGPVFPSGNPTSNASPRQPTLHTGSSYGYPSQTQSMEPRPTSAQVQMNQRSPAASQYPQRQPVRSVPASSEFYGQQRGSGMPIGNTVPNVNNNGMYGAAPSGESFPSMGENLNPLPFEPAASQAMGGHSSSPYGAMPMPAPAMNTYMNDMPAASYPPPPMGGPSYDALPNLYDNGAPGAPPSAPNVSGGWQGPANPMGGYTQSRTMQSRSPTYPSGSMANGMDMSGGGNLPMGLDPMPLLPNGSGPMAFPSAPAPNSGALPPPGNAYRRDNSSGDYVNFVAGNDPQLPPDGGANQVNYYDANGPAYRGVADFEVDTSNATLSGNGGSPPGPSASEAAAIADVDTEPESPSISQATTPAQSESEGERIERDRQRDREAQLARLNAASNALQSSAAAVVQQPASEPTSSQATSPGVTPGALKAAKARHTAKPSSSQDTETVGDPGASRRSSRVSRKITSNIGDMYDPELAKLHAHSRGSGVHDSGVETAPEPTDGELGELATELLEEFKSTIRPLKPDVPRSLLVLRAQLLEMEAVVPRDAFRLGRWSRAVRAAWAEKVYSCDSSAALLESVVFLETNIESDWLDPCWKASPLQTAKNALASVTIASAAMRLYALDDAISYGRMKRGSKRRHKAPSSASSSRPGSPVRSAIFTEESTTSGPASHPSELPFMAALSPGVVALGDKMIHRLLAGQRDKSLTTYAARKIRNELGAIASLTDEQVEQWVSACSAQPSSGSTTGSSATQAGATGRHATPKRKHPGPQGPPSGSQRSSSSRRRRASTSPSRPSTPPSNAAEMQRVELPCFQMRASTHYFPNGNAPDATLKPRLEYIMDILLRNELALAFASPVNVNDVPGYAELIKHPMDLGTVKMRLTRDLYAQRYELLVRDVNLVWENCFTFNRLDADISKCANRLRSIFNRLFETWISDVPPHTPVAQLPSEEQCRQCGQINAQDSMLLCDSCDAAYHLFCLQPPLAAIPAGNWYCPRCPMTKLTM